MPRAPNNPRTAYDQACHEVPVIKRHFAALNQWGRRLRTQPYGSAPFPPDALTDRFPGLRQLMGTLVCSSDTARENSQREVEEWNPLAQRVLLPDDSTPPMKGIERDFNRIRAHAQTFIEWSHEAVHVLGLEPFLCGTRRFTSPGLFGRWHLAGEALAFWFADMVVTPGIRQHVPEAEFVYGRSAVSNLTFHPQEVFQRLGLSEHDEVLQAYLQAFTQQAGHAMGRGNDPFVRHLGRQIAHFYKAVRLPTRHWHWVLQEFGFFSGYMDRYTGIEGLPSLLSPEQQLQAARLSPQQCMHLLGREVLPGLARLPERTRRAVAARRHLQTRAYHSWWLAMLLEKDWLMHRKPTAFKAAAVAQGLQQHLARLEQGLQQLAHGGSPADALQAARQADEAYERDVRAPFLKADSWLRYRYAIYPAFAASQGVLGMADEARLLGTKGMRDTVAHLMQRFDWQAAATQPKAARALLQDLAALWAAGTQAQVREAYNRVMVSSAFLPAWSVPLASVDPLRNHFREPAYAYA